VARLEGHFVVGQGEGLVRSDGDIERFLRGAVKVTGLTPISPYQVVGDHGIVIIAESHITASIYGERGFVTIFSCRAFVWEKALLMARNVFKGRWQPYVFGGEPVLRRDGPK
jgi:S-adenosylmethionine/arginine decarboxylase-like enzyme